MARRPGPDSEKDVQLSVVLPAAIVRAVKVRAADRGETLRGTVLRALKADGFKTPDREIADRRLEANHRAGALSPELRGGLGPDRDPDRTASARNTLIQLGGRVYDAEMRSPKPPACRIFVANLMTIADAEILRGAARKQRRCFKCQA
jgi:hypothetical protein